MRLVMPLPPNVANERGHWRTRNRRKLAFMGECDHRQLLGLIPPPPERPWSHVTLAAHFHLHNLMDKHDNLRFRLKYPSDWLVTRGYIDDDGPDNITVVGVDQCIDRKDKRLVLDLEAP